MNHGSSRKFPEGHESSSARPVRSDFLDSDAQAKEMGWAFVALFFLAGVILFVRQSCRLPEDPGRPGGGSLDHGICPCGQTAGDHQPEHQWPSPSPGRTGLRNAAARPCDRVARTPAESKPSADGPAGPRPGTTPCFLLTGVTGGPSGRLGGLGWLGGMKFWPMARPSILRRGRTLFLPVKPFPRVNVGPGHRCARHQRAGQAGGRPPPCGRATGLPDRGENR